MNRLWIRLSIAFIVVTQLSLIVLMLTANLTISAEFRRYVVQRESVQVGSLPDTLVTHYQQTGSWAGVGETYRRFLVGTPASDVLFVGRAGELPTVEAVQQPLPIMIADAQGIIVFDTNAYRTGTKMRGDEPNIAIPLQLSGNDQAEKTIGFIVPRRPPLPIREVSPEGNFLSRLGNFFVSSSIVIGLISVLVALVLSRTLSAPLARLTLATRHFASRDFAYRLPVKGASEIASVARAFNEMANEVQHNETLRRNMIADIAHELRTPLTVMQGNLRAILDGVYAMDKGEIATLYDETRVLSRLVDDLRELAMADAGKLNLQLTETHVAELLKPIVANFTVTADEQATSLMLDVATDLPCASADVTRLRQIVSNLVSNALRHTNGGSVTVAAHRHDMENAVCISVKDTGEGIAPDELARIFERFYRGDKSRTRASGGTGLGLTISKAWVEAMGGKIGVESTVGKGTHFWFTVPFATPTPTESL